jgi:hypothetical protein
MIVESMSNIGRPTKLTPETIKKLEEVFAMDGTVKEACFYAGISTQTYYTFVKNEPEFLDRFNALRESPVLKARKAIFDNLDKPQCAQWYLSRKRKEEFTDKEEVIDERHIEAMLRVKYAKPPSTNNFLTLVVSYSSIHHGRHHARCLDVPSQHQIL